MATPSYPLAVQVTNVCPLSDRECLTKLFSFVGVVQRMALNVDPQNPEHATAYIQFTNPEEAALALHMTNVHWMDRPLVVIPAQTFPGEELPLTSLLVGNAAAITAAAPKPPILLQSPQPIGGTAGQLGMAAASVNLLNPTTIATGLMGVAPGLLPTPPGSIFPGLPTSSLTTTAANPVTPAGMLAGLTIPPPPPLSHNVDPQTADSIRRTVYVGNLDTKVVTADDLVAFFKICGPISYVRLAGDETQPTRFAFVEFIEVTSANASIALNGHLLKDKPIRVSHSKNAIVKPQLAKHEKKQSEEAAKKAMEMMTAIASKKASSEAEATAKGSEDRDRDRGASSSKTRSPRRRSRSRSHSRSRSRSRQRSPYSRHGRRSSPSRRSPDRRRDSDRSRERDRDRDRGRDRGRDRERDRERDRDREKSRGSDRDRNRDRDRERDKDKEREKDKQKEKSEVKEGVENTDQSETKAKVIGEPNGQVNEGERNESEIKAGDGDLVDKDNTQRGQESGGDEEKRATEDKISRRSRERSVDRREKRGSSDRSHRSRSRNRDRDRDRGSRRR